MEGLSEPVGPYKHVTAKKIGDSAIELLISGMLPVDNEGQLVGGLDVDAQTRQIIDNIATAVADAATHYGHNLNRHEALRAVTDTLVFLKSMGHFGEVNDAYPKYGLPHAMRAAVEVNDFPTGDKGSLLEIRANAYIPAVAKGN